MHGVRVSLARQACRARLSQWRSVQIGVEPLEFGRRQASTCARNY